MCVVAAKTVTVLPGTTVFVLTFLMLSLAEPRGRVSESFSAKIESPKEMIQMILTYVITVPLSFATYFPNEPPCFPMWFHCVVRCYNISQS